jgi:hypothetical protein
MPPSRKKFLLRRWWLILLGAFALWFFLPRHADTRGFDPAGMGHLEAAMWRHYYDKNYPALGWDLFRASYIEYGFSPWDSVRMAWHAATAARLTQPSQPRASAFEKGLPHLTKYYEVVKAATRASWNPEEMAPLELEWWVQRRENKTWREYGEAITQLTAAGYEVPAERVRPACLLRAEMMHYRDQRRNGRMTAADWQHIASELTRAYTLLREAAWNGQSKWGWSSLSEGAGFPR